MPYKCCVPFCRRNYVGGPKVHAFSFPLDKELSKKWVYAIHREDFTPSKYSGEQSLIYNDELIIEDNYSLIKSMSRGKLFYPQALIVQLFFYSFIIFNKFC